MQNCLNDKLTRLSEKFQNQYKEQTNNKVPLKHSPIIQDLILNMAVKLKKLN